MSKKRTPAFDVHNPNDPNNPHSRLGAGRNRVQAQFRSGETVGGEIEEQPEEVADFPDSGDPPRGFARSALPPRRVK